MFLLIHIANLEVCRIALLVRNHFFDAHKSTPGVRNLSSWTRDGSHEWCTRNISPSINFSRHVGGLNKDDAGKLS